MTLCNIEDVASIPGWVGLYSTMDDKPWTGTKVGLQFGGLSGQQ